MNSEEAPPPLPTLTTSVGTRRVEITLRVRVPARYADDAMGTLSEASDSVRRCAVAVELTEELL